MAMGCCGPRVISLRGLLAEADTYPASSRRGQVARASLAYAIAAGKAAQRGNRPAYDRAMRGLQGITLGTLNDDFQAILSRTSISPADLAAVQQYTRLFTGLAQLGTGIASQVPGADQNAINVINIVVSWIRALVTPGAQITVPTMDQNTLNAFAQFCVWKDIVKNGIIGVFGVVLGLASSDANATRALTTIQNVMTGLIDDVCGIPSIATATQNHQAAGICADGGAIGPHWVVNWRSADGTQITCGCEPGYTAMPDHTCQPTPATPPGPASPFSFRPGLVPGFRPTPITLPAGSVRCWNGTMAPSAAQCPPQSAPSSGGTSAAVIAIPAAALLWWLL